jgi:formate/nitrite transporter FocA (FNT family)
MGEAYRILDEPAPGPFARLSVSPFWPLLSSMLAGAWLGWSWFAANALLIGSASRRREIAWIVGGVAVNVAMGLAIVAADDAGLFTRVSAKFVILLPVFWKLFVSYWLFNLQVKSFSLYRYFGGRVSNGVLVLLAGFYLRTNLPQALFPASGAYSNAQLIALWTLF